jgi:hypothetical protein
MVVWDEADKYYREVRWPGEEDAVPGEEAGLPVGM